MIDFALLAWSQIGGIAKAVLAGFLAIGFLAWLDRRPFAKDIARFTIPQALYLSARILAVGLVLAALVGCSPPARAAAWPTRYDAQIQAAAATYMPGVPWRLYRSQLVQESGLNPAARSPAGAEGLAQFMPATWAEMTRLQGLGLVARTDAGASITLGAVYMARLRRQWVAERPWRDRHSLALASYNAGLGSILRAQEACARPAFPADPWLPTLYLDIVACLPQITGRYAAETIAYAPSIFRRWAIMEGGA